MKGPGICRKSRPRRAERCKAHAGRLGEGFERRSRIGKSYDGWVTRRFCVLPREMRRNASKLWRAGRPLHTTMTRSKQGATDVTRILKINANRGRRAVAGVIPGAWRFGQVVEMPFSGRVPQVGEEVIPARLLQGSGGRVAWLTGGAGPKKRTERGDERNSTGLLRGEEGGDAFFPPCLEDQEERGKETHPGGWVSLASVGTDGHTPGVCVLVFVAPAAQPLLLRSTNGGMRRRRTGASKSSRSPPRRCN